jgi:hypothetical protein
MTNDRNEATYKYRYITFFFKIAKTHGMSFFSEDFDREGRSSEVAHRIAHERADDASCESEYDHERDAHGSLGGEISRRDHDYFGWKRDEGTLKYHADKNPKIGRLSEGTTKEIENVFEEIHARGVVLGNDVFDLIQCSRRVCELIYMKSP